MPLAAAVRGAVGLLAMFALASCGTMSDSDRPEVASVTIWPDTASVVVGASRRLDVIVQDEDGDTLSDRTVYWVTRDSSVVTVSESGLVRGIAIGTGEVAAVSEGVHDVAAVTVTPKPPARLEIVGDYQRVGTVGSTLSSELVVRATNEGGEGVAGVTVTWSVAEGSGSTTPAQSVTDESGYARTSWTLGTTAGNQSVSAAVAGVEPVTFVTRAEPGPAATVVISPGDIRFGAIGSQTQLVATAADRYGNRLPEPSFAWSSNSEGVATVEERGLLISRGNGTALITAQSGEASDTITVVVQQIVNSVAVSPPSFTMYAGQLAQLIATAADSNGVVVPDVSFEWSTSNPAVALVDQEGRVLALFPGTATIAAQTRGVTGTSTVEVQLFPSD